MKKRRVIGQRALARLLDSTHTSIQRWIADGALPGHSTEDGALSLNALELSAISLAVVMKRIHGLSTVDLRQLFKDLRLHAEEATPREDVYVLVQEVRRRAQVMVTRAKAAPVLPGRGCVVSVRSLAKKLEDQARLHGLKGHWEVEVIAEALAQMAA